MKKSSNYYFLPSSRICDICGKARGGKGGFSHDKCSRIRQQQLNTTVKQCSKCHSIKSTIFFSKNKKHRDGLHNECKSCTNSRNTIKQMEKHFFEKQQFLNSLDSTSL